MRSETDRTPAPPRFGLGEEPAEPARPSGAGRRRFAIACLAVFVVLGAALAWQAVEHRRVRADLDAAASVFDGARDARARDVVPESWQRAAEAMDAAMAELHRQQERFVLFRSYGRFRELLASAVGVAREARSLAEAAPASAPGKEVGPSKDTPEPPPVAAGPTDAGGRAREAIDAVKATLERANASLARVSNCPRAMREIGIRRYVQAAGGTLESMGRQVGEIDARFERGDLFGATVAAESLKGKVDPIVKDLDGMATKVRCKKTQ